MLREVRCCIRGERMVTMRLYVTLVCHIQLLTGPETHGQSCQGSCKAEWVWGRDHSDSQEVYRNEGGTR